MRKGVEIMERLTTKIDDIYTCSYCENIEAIRKLGKFEDFMEEVGAESLDEIETCIVDLNKENQTLKGNWAKLREWIKDRRDENGSKYFDNEMIEDVEILEKMQELESADGEL